jgi:hypothetical protein
MAEDASKDADGKFDVVMVHGKTDDGEGAKVLRARPGRLDAGEVRPLRDGKPIASKGEIVRLEKRQDTPLYDVHVEHTLGEAQEAPRGAHHGPAQVATQSYRESWERIFGGPRDAPN